MRSRRRAIGRSQSAHARGTHDDGSVCYYIDNLSWRNGKDAAECPVEDQKYLMLQNAVGVKVATLRWRPYGCVRQNC
jgi:hypothetical protein